MFTSGTVARTALGMMLVAGAVPQADAFHTSSLPHAAAARDAKCGMSSLCRRSRSSALRPSRRLPLGLRPRSPLRSSSSSRSPRSRCPTLEKLVVPNKQRQHRTCPTRCPSVGRSDELFPDGFGLHLLQPNPKSNGPQGA
ncbi:hypothetical protein T484DRAFT_2476955 [Baffinella frigidus]|nr:hypothetical protein T484DRAFT_2476955 [Cryptophyta sp. CCMP2293]